MISKNLLEQELLKGANDGVFPGCSYLLIDGKRTYKGCVGKRSLVPLEDFKTYNDLYDLASVTKVVGTVSGIMKLLENGKLRLDDNVKELLPELKNFSDIRIVNLLTHTAGLRPFIACSEYKTKEELLEKIYGSEPISKPGEQIVYSDLSFILLGFIIEKISGVTLDTFLKNEVFKQMEMFDTNFNPQDKNRCVPTEVVDGKPVIGTVHDERARDLGGVAGHAGLFSTIDDLDKFIRTILNFGKYKNKQVFSKQIVDLLFKPLASSKDGVLTREETRSLGWILKGSHSCGGDLVSEETIMHTGFTGTHLFIDRKNQVAFVILSNRVNPTRNNTKHIAFRARLGNLIMSKR